MNRTVFIELLHKPHLAGKEHEQDLRNLVHEYPWFQAARLLLAKNLHNQNSYLFEKELKTSALYAGSRKVLYELIHQPAPAEETIAISQAAPEPPAVAEPAVIETPAEQPLPEETGHTIEPVLEAVPEQLDEAQTAEPETIPPLPETLPPAEPIHVPSAQEAVLISEAEPHPLAEWLRLLSKPHTFVPAPEAPAAEIQATPVAPPEPEKPATVEPAPVNKTQAFDADSIIEKFIRENPSISRPKAEFFNPVSMAKNSIEEDDEMVTETLAKIYAKQGNYKKAIRMYEKLCLKFPDKMPYFVSLIQKMKADNKLD